jgi:cell division transport system permease protein
MNFRLGTYFLKNALLNILSNRLIHVISIGTIFISFILLGAFLLLFVNLNNWIMSWEPPLTMSLYIKDGLGDNAIKKIAKAIEKMPDAEIVEFISKEKALKTLKESLGAQSGLLEGLGENPLPASFEIFFRESEDKKLDPKTLKEELEKIEGIVEVQYSEQFLSRFEGLVYILKVGGFIIGGLLSLAVLFITTNTIKLTIYARRNEIEIFKLVGATDRFIKAPFLLEGAIQGAFSGLLAMGALYIMYSLLSVKKIHLFGLPVLDVIFLPDTYTIFILMLGLVLGLLGGLIAVGRFFNL